MKRPDKNNNRSEGLLCTRSHSSCSFCYLFFFLSSVAAQSGGTFTITKSAIAGGGGQATGGIFSLDGTIDQSLAGTTSAGETFELGNGFWGGGSAPASGATVSGRVVTPRGLGLRNAVVALTDSQGVRRTATTSSFGFYSFDNVPSGQNYIIGVSSKRYRFAARSLLVNGNLSNVDFVELE